MTAVPVTSRPTIVARATDGLDPSALAVLEELFNLRLRAVIVGSQVGTFHPRLLVRALAATLKDWEITNAIGELMDRGLVHREGWRWGLSAAGHRAVAEIVDIDQAIATARDVPNAA